MTGARPQLIAIGGVSGSGKTTLARLLAKHVDAVHIDSDALRKEIFGRKPSEKLPPECYSAASTAQLLQEVKKRTARHLSNGETVIYSSTFTNKQIREDFIEFVKSCSADFNGLWLETDRQTLFNRVAARVGTGDASDADASIILLQTKNGMPQSGWPVIDAGQPREKVLSDALKLLRLKP